MKRPADIIVTTRRERRERRQRYLADVIAGMRAGLSTDDAAWRADELADARACVLAEHERREAS